MPNVKGENIARRVLAMSEEEIHDRNNQAIRWTVTNGTAEGYESKIREIKIFAVLLKKEPTAFETIKLYLTGLMADGYSASVGNSSACAWKFLRKLSGLRKLSITRAEQIQDFIDGWNYRGDEQYKTPRGVLDSMKLQQLSEFAHEKGLGMYAMGFVLAWQVMLRHGRLPEFIVGNVRLGTDAGDIIWVSRRKNYNRKTMRNQTRGHFKAVKNMSEELRRWTQGRGENEKLFPGWDQKTACAIVRECAIVLKWDTTVEWDGPHCERYGARQEELVLSRAAIKMMLLCKRADWNSKGSAKRYGRK